MLHHMMAAKRKKSGVKYQFGFRVPKTIKEAYELDKLNGNTHWKDDIKKEVMLLKDIYE